MTTLDMSSKTTSFGSCTVNSHPRVYQYRSLGVRDRQGRRVGYQIRIWEAEVSIRGKVYAAVYAEVGALRDDAPFGRSTRRNYQSLGAAARDSEKRFEAYRRRFFRTQG